MKDNNNMNITNTDYNIFKEAINIYKNIKTKEYYKWIKSHQYKNKQIHELLQLAKINIRANKLAAEERRKKKYQKQTK